MQWNYHTNFLDLHERRLCVSAGRQRFQKWLMRDNEVGGMFIYYILIVMLSCLVFSLKSTSKCPTVCRTIPSRQGFLKSIPYFKYFYWFSLRFPQKSRKVC